MTYRRPIPKAGQPRGQGRTGAPCTSYTSISVPTMAGVHADLRNTERLVRSARRSPTRWPVATPRISSHDVGYARASESEGEELRRWLHGTAMTKEAIDPSVLVAVEEGGAGRGSLCGEDGIGMFMCAPDGGKKDRWCGAA